jgi:hypothetical protein
MCWTGLGRGDESFGDGCVPRPAICRRRADARLSPLSSMAEATPVLNTHTDEIISPNVSIILQPLAATTASHGPDTTAVVLRELHTSMEIVESVHQRTGLTGWVQRCPASHERTARDVPNLRHNVRPRLTTSPTNDPLRTCHRRCRLHWLPRRPSLRRPGLCRHRPG